jgi:hypothetical protein
MKRSVFVCALLVVTAGALAAQQASQSNDPYVGISHPPPDTTITTPEPPPLPKPSPAKLAPAPAAAQPGVEGAQAPAGEQYAEPDTDDGIVRVAPDATSPAQPELNQRENASDPDGDIVHPAPLPAGELGSGTTIRARLLEEISTTFSRNGDAFRARVASDVFRGNNVLIPTGAEIDGTVEHVSTGHAAGHGSMNLRPDIVILPNGSRFHLYAQLTGAPGSRTRVSGEGAVTPGSRMKKDEIEYGGAVGTGVIAGAVLGGPVGALAGSLVGAGAVTAHLVMDHPQATLPTGTVLMFTLTETLNLAPANPAGSPVAEPAANPVASAPTDSVPTPAASQAADPAANSAANPDVDSGEVGDAGPH